MKAIRHHVQGKMLFEAPYSALLLQEMAESICLRYAYVFQGKETPIFPAFVLDDWGSEIKGLGLYQWVRQFGDQFPRAEMFGFELNGRETQCFLRELELQARLLCYAYPTRDTPLAEGIAVEAILLPDASSAMPQRIKRPSSIPRPLRSVKAMWWSVNPAQISLSTLFN